MAQVSCGVCHPFSGHLFARTTELSDLNEEGMTMTNDFCEDYVTACKGDIDFASDFCDVHTLGKDTDDYWSYPLTTTVGEFLTDDVK